MVYPRNARSLVAWIPVDPGDVVGLVGNHPPLQRSLADAGAKVVDLPPEPPADARATEPVDHLVLLAAAANDPWLTPGAIAGTVRTSGTVLVAVRHRWNVLGRGGLSAGQLQRSLTGEGVADCRVLGGSHGLYNLRALVPLDAPLMRWYAEHMFLPRSYRGALGIGLLCRLGMRAPLRALFPMLVGVGTVRTPA